MFEKKLIQSHMISGKQVAGSLLWYHVACFLIFSSVFDGLCVNLQLLVIIESWKQVSN